MTTYADLQQAMRGLICVLCGTEPRIAYLEGNLKLRCNCKGADNRPQPPVLGKPNSIVKERMGQLVEQQGQTALATQEGALRLAQEVKQYLAPKATDVEVAVFIRFCRALGLNPFIKEVYLVKYDDRAPAAIVVGIQAYLKWAARNPAWGGFESGIVVLKDGRVEEREGSLALQGEILVGGWCVVHRTGSVKLKRIVSLSEYNKGQSLWKTMPATMIEKVAIGQAVRRAFPEDFLAFQGLAERIAVTVDEQVGERDADPLPRRKVDTQRELGFGPDGDLDPDTQEGLQADADAPFLPETPVTVTMPAPAKAPVAKAAEAPGGDGFPGAPVWPEIEPEEIEKRITTDDWTAITAILERQGVPRADFNQWNRQTFGLQYLEKVRRKDLKAMVAWLREQE